MMLTSVHSTSPSASSRSVLIRRQRQVAVLVHTPSALLGGITCQIGSSMLAVAPNSKARRKKLADKSIWRTPGARRLCTSTIASSVILIAVRMHDNWSGVLTDLAALTMAPASTGAPLGNNDFPGARTSRR